MKVSQAVDFHMQYHAAGGNNLQVFCFHCTPFFSLDFSNIKGVKKVGEITRDTLTPLIFTHFLREYPCQNSPQYKFATTKPTNKVYKLSDRNGLFLHIATSGRKTWVYRYKVVGRESMFAFVEYPKMTLE